MNHKIRLFVSSLLLVAALCGVAAGQTFSDPGFVKETVATLPPYVAVGLTFAPDGRIFVWQKDGVVWIIKNGALLPTPFLDIRSKVNQAQDRGLLGLALDPNFATNGFVYLAYTFENGTNPNDIGPKTARITRVKASTTNPDIVQSGSEVILLGSIGTPSCNLYPSTADCIASDAITHTIGTLRFAADGKLMISTGDGADFNAVSQDALRSQDLDNLAGKILRVNPDGTAPTDNPFYTGTNSNRSKVWAYGLRNPYRFGLDASGNVWFGDVGWNTWEEVNKGTRGSNYGWPCYEGVQPQPQYQSAFAQCRQLSSSAVVPPVYTWDHSSGSAASIGGAFYTGNQYPTQYRNTFFFADYARNWIQRLVLDTSGNLLSVQPFATGMNGPVSVELGPDGMIYFVSILTGEIGRIRYSPNTPPVAKAAATPTFGYSPLTVNFSSAGSNDPGGSSLTYLWDFGDGTPTTTVINPSHTYVATGVKKFTATLTVTNSQSLSSTASVVITVGSTPPTAVISAPINNTHVRTDQVINFSGSASDPDDGALPGTQLSWTILLHHNEHIHPYASGSGTSGNFVVSLDDPPGVYSYDVILTATDSSGLTDTKTVNLPVDLPGVTFLGFNYPDRNSLLAAGWSYLAKTAAGATRNTEQTGTLAVDYNQTTHPNTLRVPLGSGENWGTSNNSQNTLFYNLPSDFTSVRLRIAAFNPVANYQQTGLLIYQDDDNYVLLNRSYVDGGGIEIIRELGGSPIRVARAGLLNSVNLILRIDRDAATGTYTGYYSIDDGQTWITVANTVAALTAPKLAIQAGANLATVVYSDLGWAEIIQPVPAGPPLVSGVSPTSGNQGQTLNVTVSGSGFISGATCNFGAGITVNSCTVNTTNQITANVSISPTATVGNRSVTITNPDTQSATLSNSFAVNQVVLGPPPVLNSINPTSGQLGQTLNVTLSGSNFSSGASCSFGAGITTNSCTFNSSTQLTANINISFGANTGARSVTVTNSDGQPSTLTNAFTVTAGSGAAHIDFNYADRTALLNAGWSYIATTAGGGSRNTEQTGTLAVNYDQTAHPGVIRIPVGAGENWASINNSQNTLFRTLPSDWTSVKLYIANFNPANNYQQVGLQAYQDDDNYVDVNRVYSDGGQIEMFREAAAVTSRISRNTLTNSGGLFLRLDRNAATNTYTGFYSTDGINFTSLGSTVFALTNPQLAIMVGANAGGTTPNADLGWIEITRPAPAPAPTLTSASPNTSAQGLTLNVILTGTNFQSGPSCGFGAGITVNSCTFSSATQITANVTISNTAATGTRNVTVTNTDGQVATLTNGFTVTLAPAPTVTSTTPNNAAQGATLNIVIAGTNFMSGATCDFGAGIAVTSCTFNNASQMTAAISIASGATVGSRNVTVTNPNSQAGTNTGGFTVNQFVPTPPPNLTSLNPTSGTQGQTLSVTLTGGSFQAGASCSFGTGITVNSCAFNTATQMTANITIAAAATVGTRSVTVTNPDSQSSTLANSFTVNQFVAPAPTLTSATPNSGSQGIGFNIVLAGTNFQSGATCSFGAGITVNSCTFNSASQLTASITILGNAATGSRTITVTNPDNQTASLTNGFTVTAATSGVLHFDFTYPDRTSFGAAGWDYLAKTSGGATRDTEGTGSLLTDYNQTAHPGVIRVPLGSGELWQSLNNSNNTIFRDLPSDWTSVRVKIATFNPTANYQQVGLLAYQDDNNYIDVNRSFVDGAGIELFSEANAATARVSRSSLTNTGNLILRLDRISTNNYTAYYSTDGAITWTSIGSVAIALSNIRLGIQIGSDQTGTFPKVDIAWAEVYRPAPAQAPTVSSVVPNSGLQGQTLSVQINGSNFQNGATCSFGTGITVNSCTFTSATQLTAGITVSAAATTGARTVTVTNPDSQTGSLASAFTVTSAPAPTVTSVSPSTGSQSSTLTATITGTNFLAGATCDFGAGITVNSCTFNNSTSLSANITIALSAATGARTVTVTNPNTTTGSKASAFTVTVFVPPPAPVLSSISPTSGSQGANLNVGLTGSNFLSGATCSFGAGVVVNSCTFNSSTSLTASIAIDSLATVGTRSVTVTNPDSQASTLANAFTITQSSQLGTVAVLVNSANSTGYNTSPSNPGEFQRYPQVYLDHLQVPYEIIDTATTTPPGNLTLRQLIIAGHSGLNLNSTWQTAIRTAVQGGAGFVNLDSATNIGAQVHIQSFFGATGATVGTAATSISVPAALVVGGASPHFITAMQQRFLGDPAGDIVYNFHVDKNGVLQTAAPTLLTNGVGTVIAKLGTNPLILANSFGSGRVINFGTYLYLKADRFGFLQGVDDLFWRSLVWAARKPFVLRGFPRWFAVQMDDTQPGWGSRVRDFYNTSLTGTPDATGAGGPWKVTGYVYTDSLPPSGSDRALVISDITAGKLEVSPHSFGDSAYGNMYWNGPSNSPLTDAGWTANLQAIQAWINGNGGSDRIPSLSRSVVGHYWDLSNNIGPDIWTTLGTRYITAIQHAGYQLPPNDNLGIYGGAERLQEPQFWQYEMPPKLTRDESYSFFFADDFVIGGRSGQSPQTFFGFATQYIDPRYVRTDLLWPGNSFQPQSVAAAVDQLQRYSWRHYSSMDPVQMYTHDNLNFQTTLLADRQSTIQLSSTWLQSIGAKHIFMDDLGDYIYARNKSKLTSMQLSGTNIQLGFSGRAATADGALIQTQAMVFYQDVEAVPVTVAGFTNGLTTTVALPTPPPTISSISPTSGTTSGGTSVTINGNNFTNVISVTFGGTPATSFTVNSVTKITAVTPGAAATGAVDVSVKANAGTATSYGAFTYGATGLVTHYDFNYASRTALLADGWTYTATTAIGGSRNTEQSGALAPDYSQTTHPGSIRIPLGSGELWGTSNNSQNMLVRSLPIDWTSIRINISAFAPAANYQQVGLIAYQDDDNYISVSRSYVDGGGIEVIRETTGSPSRVNRLSLTNTGNLILRLDRDASTNTYTGYYSTDGGSNWTTIGTTTLLLNNLKLAIQSGANLGAAINTDLAWAEVKR